MSAEQTNLVKILKKGQKSRQLVLDYALGASILGLIPIGGILTLKIVMAIALMLKMLWDLNSIWRVLSGQDGLAIAGYMLGWIGGIIMSLLIWFVFFAVGLYVPYVRSFAIAVSFFTFVWIIGQATNHFYQTGQIETYSRHIKS